jgi:nickel-dependent lactate racemase
MSKVITVPYGKSAITCEVDDARTVTILRPNLAGSAATEKEEKREQSESAIIKESLAHPTGSLPLFELAQGKRRVLVITSDHTRPVPSRLTLPPMLEEIRRASPAAKITILIATGAHRASTKEEIEQKFGAEMVLTETIVNHNPYDDSNLVMLGTLPSGGSLIVNRLAMDADLLVADGFIEPHQFAGFSGGRKSILPGISSLKTVLASHNAVFTVHPRSRPGILDGNPFHDDMLYAARRAGLAFILNVVLSPDKKVIGAFAGDVDAAHRKGCAFVLECYGVNAVRAPLVITSNGGYPLDQNMYQAAKSIVAADFVCGTRGGALPDGVIIAVNECRDGCGGDGFYASFRDASSLDALLAGIQGRSADQTRDDQWAVQLLATVLKKRTVFFVSGAPRSMVETMYMRYASTLQEAVNHAGVVLGNRDASITVLPEALSLVIKE